MKVTVGNHGVLLGRDILCSGRFNRPCGAFGRQPLFRAALVWDICSPNLGSVQIGPYKLLLSYSVNMCILKIKFL